MPQAIDPQWLGERLRETREKQGLTLQKVADATGISVPTLSRIERGVVKGLSSDTLVTLCGWMGTDVEMLKTTPSPTIHRGKTITSTPEIVELHLRADKNLDKKTAAALANLFKSVYEQLTRKMKEP